MIDEFDEFYDHSDEDDETCFFCGAPAYTRGVDDEGELVWLSVPFCSEKCDASMDEVWG